MPLGPRPWSGERRECVCVQVLGCPAELFQSRGGKETSNVGTGGRQASARSPLPAVSGGAAEGNGHATGEARWSGFRGPWCKRLGGVRRVSEKLGKTWIGRTKEHRGVVPTITLPIWEFRPSKDKFENPTALKGRVQGGRERMGSLEGAPKRGPWITAEVGAGSKWWQRGPTGGNEGNELPRPALFRGQHP